VKSLLAVLSPLLCLACVGSAKERTASTASPSPAPAVATSALPVPTAASTSAAPSAASATPAFKSAAYPGCGEAIPLARLWDETTEGEVLDDITVAKECAAAHGRRLLLEFVAPWCEDCQEMAKLDETPEVAATLRERFERVRINVGKWDRHEALRNNFGVHALATYIVIDPNTSKELAKTTLEPITKKGQKISAAQWASWLKDH
jgi:thiol-disulfide isomerase/thioredoxin